MNIYEFEKRANKAVINWCVNRNLEIWRLEKISTGFETNPDDSTDYVASYVIDFFKKRITYHECGDQKYIELIEEVQ